MISHGWGWGKGIRGCEKTGVGEWAGVGDLDGNGDILGREIVVIFSSIWSSSCVPPLLSSFTFSHVTTRLTASLSSILLDLLDGALDSSTFMTLDFSTHTDHRSSDIWGK